MISNALLSTPIGRTISSGEAQWVWAWWVIAALAVIVGFALARAMESGHRGFFGRLRRRRT